MTQPFIMIPSQSGEMGAIWDVVVDSASSIIDVLAGGPQKRERTAKANARAAEAQLAAARLGVQSERYRAEAALQRQRELMIGGAILIAVAAGAYLVVK